MLDPRFVILAALFDLVGCLLYARDTWRGTTHPNRVSWVIWGASPLITFAAQVAQGVALPALLTLASVLGPFFVVLASFANRKAYWQITKFDLICGACAVLALILWGITRTGNLAIVFSMLADTLATTPTLVKAYRHPASESAAAYLLATIAGIITLFTITTWDFATAGYSIFLIAICAPIYLLIKFPDFRVKIPEQG